MSRPMNIGEAAEAAGVSTKMIRHYEQIGLLPAAARTDSGYRQYGERDVSLLHFVRQSRRLGFSIDQIADLLGLWSNDRRTSREVKALAQGHLDALEEKMREIAEMQHTLKKLVGSCHGNDEPHCAILDELAVSSPEAPEPGAVGAKLVRKPGPKTHAQKASVREAPSVHADLMAWTRSIHAGPGHH
ncbi:MAG: Cu(I)-responsive transcriptional regulator [Rhizobacter sp.]